MHGTTAERTACGRPSAGLAIFSLMQWANWGYDQDETDEQRAAYRCQACERSYQALMNQDDDDDDGADWDEGDGYLGDGEYMFDAGGGLEDHGGVWS